MPRSVALTGLMIVMSLAMVGFAAFSYDIEASPGGADVPVAASVAAVVFATPLSPHDAGPAAAAVGVPLGETLPAPLNPTTTTTSTSIPSTTIPSTTIPSTTIPSTTIPSTTIPSTTTTTAPAAMTAQPPATTVPPTTTVAATTAVAAASAWPAAVEQWRGLVAAYFTADRVEEALAIISCESNGDPGDVNPASGAAGLFQFLPSTWNSIAGHMGVTDYASGAPLDPTLNTAAAAWLVQDSIDGNDPRGPWGPWSCRWMLE